MNMLFSLLVGATFLAPVVRADGLHNLVLWAIFRCEAFDVGSNESCWKNAGFMLTSLGITALASIVWIIYVRSLKDAHYGVITCAVCCLCGVPSCCCPGDPGQA